ncbi:STAS domain-containing protein [Streptomyces sp. 147326]|uniref:STAS domain-containing protein n=1 Tax=Streptomyces sp. 147326 TaxID=3074379 RepID=UPI003857E73F
MADDQAGRAPLVRVETGEQSVVVRVGGEIDIDRASMLRDALHKAITQRDCPNEIVVDLTEVTFCDSSGLNALLQGRLTALEHSRQVRLHAPSTQVVRLLELTGAEQLFPITARPGS